MLKAGTLLGGYEILDVIGHGAAAITYSAYRQGDRKLVALKVPRAQSLIDPTFSVRFLQEGALGSRLRHRSIVRVLEAGEDKGTPFLALEFVNGTTLADHLVAGQRYPVKQALELVREVAGALAYAHQHRVVHRNLKPAHIMLLPEGGLKVMDLGVARAVDDVSMTSPNVFLGTPAYSAPEMLDARGADHRCDLYSLGAILFEMVEGQPPFSARNVTELMLAREERGFPTRESLAAPLSDPVWNLLRRLCAEEPRDRPASADEVVAEIDRCLEGLS